VADESSGWGDYTDYSTPSYDASTYTDYSTPTWDVPAPVEQSWQQTYDYTPDPTTSYYPLQANTSQDVANRYMQQSGGNAQQALGYATQARTGAMENAPMLRDASHALWTQAAMQQNPYLASLSVPVLAPAYSAAKGLAQWVNAMNPSLGGMIDPWMARMGQQPLVNASPPSLREVWSAMRPILHRSP
jgi:hypothetical protein